MCIRPEVDVPLRAKLQAYHERLPDEAPLTTHFSNLLLSGSAVLTSVEMGLLAILLGASLDEHTNTHTCGSWTLRQLVAFMVAASLFRRAYNSFLEACFCSFPSLRTQPDQEHRLIKLRKDLNGRQLHQLQVLQWHDLGTLVSVFCLDVAVHRLVPGFYPAPGLMWHSWTERWVRLVFNHLAMSFSMYWLHRSCHNVPFMWKHIHSIHHWAKHPLSRNTYEDHWFDNFSNAVAGHLCAQVLVPLDAPTFVFSRMFRIAESLEKHSGISCRLNMAHQITVMVCPWAQMPHHHDWHHEGHKGSNYTFSSVGGVWDVLFGTRHEGRAKHHLHQATTVDKRMVEQREQKRLPRSEKTFFDTALGSLTPVACVVLAACMRLHSEGFTVGMTGPAGATLCPPH